MGLDFLSAEGLQQGGTLVGPQGHPLPLGLGLAFRAIPAACLGKTPPHGLHQLLQAGVHLLRVHAVHHLRVHAALHLETEIRQGLAQRGKRGCSACRPASAKRDCTGLDARGAWSARGGGGGETDQAEVKSRNQWRVRVRQGLTA